MEFDRNKRLIPILTMIDGELVKTRKFQYPSYVGDPLNAVRIFNEKLVDELILLDIGSDEIINKGVIEEIAGECFMPLTYGGKISSLKDAEDVFALGVEKISVNNLLFKDVSLIRKLISEFGSSSIVLSLDFLNKENKICLFDRKNNLIINFDDLRKIIFDLEVGEILMTSIDKEGTLTEPDYELIKLFDSHRIPVVYNGGVSKVEHILKLSKTGLSGIAAGSFFVYYGPYRAVLIHYPKIFEND